MLRMDSRPETGRQFDRLDAAGLVEGMAVLLVDLPEHVGRGSAGARTYQRLLCEHESRLHVDDGLEGHCEVGQDDVVAAGAATSMLPDYGLLG